MKLQELKKPSKYLVRGLPVFSQQTLRFSMLYGGKGGIGNLNLRFFTLFDYTFECPKTHFPQKMRITFKGESFLKDMLGTGF